MNNACFYVISTVASAIVLWISLFGVAAYAIMWLIEQVQGVL